MTATKRQIQKLQEEKENLQARLAETEKELESLCRANASTLHESPGGIEDISAAEKAGRLYRLMLESMQEGAAALTMNGLILYSNPCLAEMLASHLEQVQGAWLSKFLNPTDWMRVRHLLEEEPQANKYLEASLLRGNGERMPVHLTFGIAQVHDMSTVVMLASDQTEHMRLEQALQDSEALYRTLVENSDAAIAVLDRNGVYLFVNSRLANNLGKNPEEIPGMNMEDFFPKDLASQYLNNIRNVLDSQQGKVFEAISLIHGKPRLYHRSIQPILSASGKPVMALMHGVDITEIRLAKEQIAASAARYLNLFENVPVALTEIKISSLKEIADGFRAQGGNDARQYTLDHPDLINQSLRLTQIEDCNQETLHLFGAADKLDFLHNWHKTVDPETQDFLLACLNALLEQRNELTYETSMLTLSGERRNILVKLVFEQHEQEYTVLAAYTDMTERKRAETALSKLNRALKMLNACNSALVHAADEGALLNEICRLVVESGGYRMAWVGIAEQDPEKSVRPVAQYGFEEGYLERARISWADVPAGQGPTGTAIREGTIQINRNSAANPQMALWRAEALKRGYQSSIALPLKSENTVFGALTIYSSNTDAFDDEEAQLLRRLTEDLAFGIITLRERAAREHAQETTRKWEHVFEHARWGVVVSSADLKTLSLLNPEFARMHGYSIEELTGQPIQDVFTPEAWVALQGQLQQAHETGHHIFESIHQRKDGSTFPVLLDITAVKDESGKVLYQAVHVQDISERKRVEQALQQARDQLEQRVIERTAELRESERRFRLALKNTPVTVAAQDKDLRFIWAYNQRTQDPAYVLGKTDFDLFPPETAERLVALKRQVLETGEQLRQRLWISSGGRKLFIELYLEPLRDSDNEITGIGIATVDLTEFERENDD